MKANRIFAFVIFSVVLTAVQIFPDPVDNTLLKYYSALISIDLNHSIEASKVVYHLSKETKFDKEFLMSELNKVEQNIDNANINIANLLINTFDDQKKKVDNNIKNIDKHLAQASVDIKEIWTKLNKKEDISPLLSDIYYQVSKAENEDHKEINRILSLKAFPEPILVNPVEIN